MFRSLSIRNYRIWFMGAMVSNIGAWMQATTQNWVVLTELTDNDALAVGATMSLQFGPQLLLVPFTGAVADRFDRRKALMVTQASLMLLAFGLGAVLFLGIAELWHVFAFAFLLGVVNSFDAPLRQAFVSDLVGTAQLSNAVALNSASYNSARLVGPAVAGVMIAAVGSGWVFVINGCSFLAVLFSLTQIRTRRPEFPGGPSSEPYLQQLLAGFRYVRGRHDLLVIFVILFLLGAFGMNFSVMTSTMAVEFGRGAGEYGLVSSILAIGSLGGALLAARKPAARMRVVIIASGGFGVAGLVSATMPTFWTFSATLILLGFCTSVVLTTASGFVQTTSEPRLRGRVLSLYLAVVLGGAPIGAPVVGAIADTFGARWTLVVAGASGIVACVVGVTWLMVERQLRFHRGRGLRFKVTHIGRPEIDGDPAKQTETLTAPLSVLRRGYLAMREDSVPQEGAATVGVTGPIPIGEIQDDDFDDLDDPDDFAAPHNPHDSHDPDGLHDLEDPRSSDDHSPEDPDSPEGTTHSPDDPDGLGEGPRGPR